MNDDLKDHDGLQTGLAALRSLFGWPAEKPPHAPVVEGFFSPGHEKALGQFISREAKLVVELGSWLGKSTLWFLDRAPRATVVAVDTWLGSPEHYTPKPSLLGRLPTLYETFLVNCWPYRDRLIPMRTTSLVGLRLVKQAGVTPDLIYVDADHQYWAVKGDVQSAHELFPAARLIGDDYNWPGVKRAVDELARATGRTVKTLGVVWWLE